MAKQFTHYDIVISCPSDMVEERLTVQEAVREINEHDAYYRGIHFDVKYWDKDVLFGSGEPQMIINNTIICDADIIVALFWQKLGTPTERAKSGTIEEIEMMIREGKQVFVCFDERDIVIHNTGKRIFKNIISTSLNQCLSLIFILYNFRNILYHQYNYR